jgi:hypothetical protein
VLTFHFSQFRVEFYRKLEITTILSEKSVFGVFFYESPESIRDILGAGLDGSSCKPLGETHGSSSNLAEINGAVQLATPVPPGADFAFSRGEARG